jgi:broad specificity phosphatase PhoE
MYICRHSERIDEADEEVYLAWKESIDCQNDTRRPKKDIKKDPVITEQGVLYAQTLGSTLSTVVELQSTVSCIYCSRLHRCVQTAYEVAKVLNLPVYVSTGLSQTAKAIETLDSKEGFQFLSIEEIRELYKDVQWSCCDESHDTNGAKLSANAIITSPQVPWKDWLSPLKYIAKNNKISIVVAHRETIRKLVGTKVATPYCCFGIYDFYDKLQSKIASRSSSSSSTKLGFHIRETKTRDGQVIR